MSCNHAMDAQALLRINAEEETFLPVEIKVRMLMEQASMRMRASAMVGKRISQLDDAIRVRALLAIIRAKSETRSPSSSAASPSAAAPEVAEVATGPTPEDPPPSHVDVRSPRTTGRGGSPPSAEDALMFSRMAVSALKTVLFQLADEGAAETAKDLFDVYDGLVTTDELTLAASEGFPLLDVDNMLLGEHVCYRKLVSSRHRFLLRKLGVLLDMKDELDVLLELAAETEVTSSKDSFADVDLSSPENDDENQKPTEARSPTEDKEKTAAAGVVEAASSVKIMSTLHNTSWDKENGNEDATEDETDEETPPQGQHIAEVSPSH